MKINLYRPSGWLLGAFLTFGLNLVVSCTTDNPVVVIDNGNDGDDDDDDGIDRIDDDDYDVTDPSREPLAQKEYTIMFYGHGGGNLDQSILLNLRQMYEAEASSFNKVNVVVQYKNSTNPASMTGIQKAVKNFDFKRGSCFRYALDPSQGYNKKKRPNMQLTDENLYGPMKSNGNLVNMGMADTLSHFMRWAKQYFPAKKYILVLANHGGGYRPDEDMPESVTNSVSTRGVIYDDGFNNKLGDKSHLTATSISRAISNADIHLTALYFDACLMNNLETICEVMDQTDYVLASSYLTPGMGGTYAPLINCLANYPNTENALMEYHKELRQYWQKTEEKNPNYYRYHDNSLMSMARLKDALPYLGDLTEKLLVCYNFGEVEDKLTINSVMNNAFKVHPTNPYYDICNILLRLNYEEDLGLVCDAAAEALTVLDNAVLSSIGTKYSEEHYLPGPSVMLAAEGEWSKVEWSTDKEGMYIINGEWIYSWDGQATYYVSDNGDASKMTEVTSLNWGSTGDETYGKLRWDDEVGWSEWLKVYDGHPNSYSPTFNNGDFLDWMIIPEDKLDDFEDWDEEETDK